MARKKTKYKVETVEDAMKIADRLFKLADFLSEHFDTYYAQCLTDEFEFMEDVRYLFPKDEEDD